MTTKKKKNILSTLKREETMTRKATGKKVNRSAVTGKFVKKEYVKTHPKTTVTETIKRTSKKPK
jgi:hypothetical protein